MTVTASSCDHDAPSFYICELGECFACYLARRGITEAQYLDEIWPRPGSARRGTRRRGHLSACAAAQRGEDRPKQAKAPAIENAKTKANLEEFVVARALCYPDVIARHPVLRLISSDLIDQPRLRIVWQAILRADTGASCFALSVADALIDQSGTMHACALKDIGGPAFLAYLLDIPREGIGVPGTAAMMLHRSERVLELGELIRKLEAEGGEPL